MLQFCCTSDSAPFPKASGVPLIQTLLTALQAARIFGPLPDDVTFLRTAEKIKSSVLTCSLKAGSKTYEIGRPLTIFRKSYFVRFRVKSNRNQERYEINLYVTWGINVHDSVWI